MQGHDFLHELDILHQPHEVIGEELDRRHRADAARIQRRRMHVPAFHQAEHLARQPAHLQRFAVELARERIQRAHDVGDLAIAVLLRVRAVGGLGLGENAGIGLLHHLLAEIDADQVVLEDVVVEHVLGGLAEIDDPLGHVGRANAEGHVLGIVRAGGVVVAADPADAAGDEVRVARVFALHENAVAAEDGGRAVALGDLAIGEIDLRIDAETAHDPRDRIPVTSRPVAAAELVRFV